MMLNCRDILPLSNRHHCRHDRSRVTLYFIISELTYFFSIWKKTAVSTSGELIATYNIHDLSTFLLKGSNIIEKTCQSTDISITKQTFIRVSWQFFVLLLKAMASVYTVQCTFARRELIVPYQSVSHSQRRDLQARTCLF